MTRLSRNNRSLFRQTATGLALLLLLFLLPPCAAKHMPDWPKVQALSPGVITRVQLDKNEAPSGARKIKGFFSSATDTSIVLLFADGRTRTIEKRVVRTVRVRRPVQETIYRICYRSSRRSRDGYYVRQLHGGDY